MIKRKIKGVKWTIQTINLLSLIFSPMEARKKFYMEPTLFLFLLYFLSYPSKRKSDNVQEKQNRWKEIKRGAKDLHMAEHIVTWLI